jgi:pimeloyl-ACP methyl ester carboxylesterase
MSLAACHSASTQTVRVNDVTLDYSLQGQGPPLYLLHGGMESRDSFNQQIAEFSKTFTVVALDSREQGRSGRADAQISYELMSKDVIALAKHLNHESISIMGLSDGGVTAITTALNRPELVDKIVLLGANYHFDSYPDATRNFIANYEWDGNTDPNAYPGNFIKHYMTGHDDLTDFGGLLKEMSIMWTTSPALSISDLETIEAKTLVINGDHEDMALEHVLSLYNALPNAQLFIVPDGTHYALEEKPKLINSVALKFLTE